MFSDTRLASISLLFPTLVHSTSFLPFLNFTSPSPYIFHSLATLLQTYPQTLFPNGHTIASVTIPRHTLLYHGRHDNDSVPSPEWLALDIEMSYGIMGSMSDSRMLTYRTTKDVNAVYFDGTSASLMGEGTMAQMVLLYNGTENIPKRGGWGPPGHDRPDHGRGGGKENQEDEPPRRPPGNWNPLQDEYFRARGLCKWLDARGLGGKGWGYEGIVRMNAGFEVIWCDFESPSLKLVSDLNTSVPLLEHQQVDRFQELRGGMFETQETLKSSEDEGPHGPGMTDPREPFRISSMWFWFAAAAKRYFGESRIKVDTYGIFSFYEPGLQNQSSARIRSEADRLNLTANGEWKSPLDGASREEGLDQLKRRRRQHRLDSVAELDGDVMLEAVESRLKNGLNKNGYGSGLDWHYISQEIVKYYSNQLQTLEIYLKSNILRSTGEEEDMRIWLKSTRALTHWFLLPFLEYPSNRPYNKKHLATLFSLDSPLAQQTLQRCETQYDTDSEEFSSEDTVLYNAIRDIIRGICSTTIEIGLGVEYHWLLNFNTIPSNDPTQATENIEPYGRLLYDAKEWKEKVEELMAWLGWAERWTGVGETCGAGGVPYVPMWPVSGNQRRRSPPGHQDGEDIVAPPRMGWGDSEFLWSPVCVNASSYPPEEWE